MKFHCFSSPERRPASDACIVCFAKDSEQGVVPLFADDFLYEKCLPGILSKDFTAEAGTSLCLYPGEVVEKRLILLGLGDKETISETSLRIAFSKLFLSFAKKTIDRIAVLPPIGFDGHLKAIIEGISLGSYRFRAYSDAKSLFAAENIAILSESVSQFQTVESECVRVMEAVRFARDLVNKNADEISPEGFSQEVLALSGKDLVVDVFDEKWIAQQRMGLVQAVSMGAAHPARFVVMRWNGAPQSKDRTILVGKGITFDTGGLNIKTGDFMQHMKSDMAGAAAVAAVMTVLRDLSLGVNVTALIPLSENCIGSRAYKPGDVFTSRQGKTVEIANTDAEGRLILADALDYAVTEMSPSRIIDVATLTGAADVALGNQISALFSNSDALAFDLEKASLGAGEPLCRMPLRLEYAEGLKSDIADWKNVAGRSGGAINAAVFLHSFIGTTPWAHFDIAGTAFLKEAHTCYNKGATGVPIRTLVEYFSRLLQR